MLVIRPVRMNDLDQLLELTALATFGLTTLPRDRELLAKRVRASLRGFEKVEDREPAGETYLFVLEDTSTAKVIGISGIVSKVGGFEPFYAYRIEKSVQDSNALGVNKEIQILHLEMEHDGPCEIGSLFLHRQYRGGGNGRMLSLARFLFMADHREHFDPLVIAEMRGVIDERGRSAFWDALGRHFFDMEFPKADYLSIVNKQFIGDLMPRHPIYIPLLPVEAQEVIGRVHQNTIGALKLLESQGFSVNDQVDIFEAGPIVHCRRDKIRTVCESRRAVVNQIIDEDLKGEICLISNTRREFRACAAPLRVDAKESVSMRRQTIQVLEIEVGDAVRFMTLPGPGQSADRRD